MIKKLNLQALQDKFMVTEQIPDFFVVKFSNSSDYPEGPYRTASYGIALIQEGYCELKTGLKTNFVNAPAVITMGPGVIREWMNKSHDIKSVVVFFTEEFLLGAQNSANDLTNYAFFDNDDEHIHHLDTDSFSRITSIFNLITIYSQNNAVYAKNKIIKNLLWCLIHETNGLAVLSKGSHAANSNTIIERFKKELSLNFKNNRSIQFYAGRLHISPKYLSSIVKKYAGVPAKKFIDDFVLLEAKVLLHDKKYNISEVAEQLHFFNPAQFSKFFKQYTGVSPAEYRKSLHTKQ